MPVDEVTSPWCHWCDEMTGMVRKCLGWCANVWDGAQMSGMVRKCPGWCAHVWDDIRWCRNVRDGAQMSGMVRKCPGWCPNVRDGAQMSGKVHKCPRWKHKCPGWCANVRDACMHVLCVCVWLCVCVIFWVSLGISQEFQTNLCAPWDWKDFFSLVYFYFNDILFRFAPKVYMNLPMYKQNIFI